MRLYHWTPSNDRADEIRAVGFKGTEYSFHGPAGVVWFCEHETLHREPGGWCFAIEVPCDLLEEAWRRGCSKRVDDAYADWMLPPEFANGFPRAEIVP
jgi:hypothetical protein